MLSKIRGTVMPIYSGIRQVLEFIRLASLSIAIIGSWKIMEISPPLIWCISSLYASSAARAISRSFITDFPRTSASLHNASVLPPFSAWAIEDCVAWTAHRTEEANPGAVKYAGVALQCERRCTPSVSTTPQCHRGIRCSRFIASSLQLRLKPLAQSILHQPPILRIISIIPSENTSPVNLYNHQKLNFLILLLIFLKINL